MFSQSDTCISKSEAKSHSQASKPSSKPQAASILPVPHSEPRTSRTSLFGPPEKSVNLLTENFPSAVKEKVVTAIKQGNLDYLQDLTRQHPALPFVAINEEAQSALIFAVLQKQDAIIKFLVAKGANPNFLDGQGYTASDYASMDCNIDMYTFLQGDKDIANLQKLLKNIENYQADSQDKFVSVPILAQITTAILQQLERHELEMFEPEKLFHLYLTTNSLFLIIITSQDEIGLRQKIRAFFALREQEILRGDAQDYCYSLSLANELCFQIVEIVFPEEYAPNVLLHHALTANRQVPWFDPLMQTNLLPDSPQEFFRTASDHIHLYAPILDRAISQLKRGYAKQSEIWHGTDNKVSNNLPADTKEFPALTNDDLILLSKRSPTWETLINYTRRLDENLDNQRLYERFSLLRQGLLKGDVAHNGQELNAGSEANIEIASFAEWWNALRKNENGESIQKKIHALANNKMGEVLDIILDDGNANKRDATRYCIKLKGKLLEEILSDATVLTELNKIDKTIDWRVSPKQLDMWAARISEECKEFPPNMTNKSIYQAVASYPKLLKIIYKTDYIDYSVFTAAHFYLIKSRDIADFTFKEADQDKITSIIFQITDIRHISFLCTYYTDGEGHNKIAIAALLVQLQCLKNKGADRAQLESFVSYYNNTKSFDAIEAVLYAALANKYFDQAKAALEQGAKPSYANAMPRERMPGESILLEVGGKCDVRDTVQKWLPATIVDRKPDAIYIKYDAWSSKWNEWISFKDERIAKAGTCSAGNLNPTNLLQINNTRFVPSIWPRIIKDKNTEAIILLINNNHLFRIEDMKALFKIKAETDWEFVNKIINGIDINKLETTCFADLLLKAAKKGQWENLKIYLNKRMPHIETLNRLLEAAARLNHLETAKHLMTLGADPRKTQTNSALLLNVDSKCDVLDTHNKWEPAIVSNRKDNMLLIHYENWGNKYDEWIDPKKSPHRFAAYQTKQQTAQAASHTLWDTIFRDKNYPRVALLFVEHFGFGEAEQTQLLTAKGIWDWSFVQAFLSGLQDVHLNHADFLSKILQHAITTGETAMIQWMTRFKVFKEEHIECAFNSGKLAVLETVLKADKNINCTKSLLHAATQGQWDLVRKYIELREINETRLTSLLTIAVDTRNLEQVRYFLTLGAQPALVNSTNNKSLWHRAFHQNRDVDIAVEIARVHALSPEDVATLGEAKSDQDWLHLENYLAKDKKTAFPPDFLNNLLTHPFAANQERTIKFLVGLGAKMHARHIETVFLNKNVALLEWMLTVDKTICTDNLLLAAEDQNWPCILAYLKHRNPPQATKDILTQKYKERLLLQFRKIVHDHLARYQAANMQRKRVLDEIDYVPKRLAQEAKLDAHNAIPILLGCLSAATEVTHTQHGLQIWKCRKKSKLAQKLSIIVMEFKEYLRTENFAIKSDNDCVRAYKNYQVEAGLRSLSTFPVGIPGELEDYYQFIQKQILKKLSKAKFPTDALRREYQLQNQLVLTSIQETWHDPKTSELKPVLLNVLSQHARLTQMIATPASYSIAAKIKCIDSYQKLAAELPGKSQVLKKLAGAMMILLGVAAMIFGAFTTVLSLGLTIPASAGIIAGGFVLSGSGYGLFKHGESKGFAKMLEKHAELSKRKLSI